MAGMRYRLIHGYFAVDCAISYDVAVNKLPEIAAAVERILADDSIE